METFLPLPMVGEWVWIDHRIDTPWGDVVLLELGLVALLFPVSLWTRGAVFHGATLLIPLLFLGGMLTLFEEDLWPADPLFAEAVLGPAVSLVFVLGGALVACGNHLARRFPRDRGGRHLLGSGGLLLLAALLSMRVPAVWDAYGAANRALLICVATYTLGALSCFAFPTPARHHALSLCLRVLGVAIPVALALSVEVPVPWLLTVRLGLGVVAIGLVPALCIAVGLIAWLKPGYAATRHDVRKVFD